VPKPKPKPEEIDHGDKFVGTAGDYVYVGEADQINVVREEPEQE